MLDLPGNLRGPRSPASAALSPKTRRELHTTETGAPTPYYSMPGVDDSIMGWQMLDEREYVPELQWSGGEGGSTAIYERMQTDAQVKGLLLATFMPVRRLAWEVDPNGAPDEVVQHVAGAWNLPIRGDDTPFQAQPAGFNHDRHLAHALAAIAYGHYYFERIYRIEGSGSNERAVMDKLATRPPRTIWNFLTGPKGDLLGISTRVGNQPGSATPWGFTNIDANSLLPYVWEPADDGDWIGRSMLRSLYRNWLLKDRLIRVDATKHERNAMGIPWFETDPGATPAELERLALMAQEMRAGTRGGGAGAGKLMIKGVEGTLPDTIASIRYHDQQMASAFLADFVTLGKGEVGSYSLGQALIDFHAQMIGAVADWYVSSSQPQIEDEVLINWGPGTKSPRLAWTQIENADLSITDLSEAVFKGLIEVDSDFREYVGERFKIPGQDRASIEEHEEEQAAKAPATEPTEGQEESGVPSGQEGGGTTGTGDGTVHVDDHTRSALTSTAQPARSALAEAMLAAIDRNRPMAWPDLAAAVGKDSKNGTARRARDQLLADGALMKRASDGRLAPMAGLQLPDRELRRNPQPFEVEAAVDFATMEATYVSVRGAVVAAVKAAQPAQIAELQSKVVDADGNAPKLAKLSVAPVSAEMIAEYLLQAAEAGVRSAQNEHVAQQRLAAARMAEPKMPSQAKLERHARERAEVAAATLAAGFATSASKKAAALSSLPPEEAGKLVAEHLGSLSDAALREQLGGAVQQAYNGGRFDYMAGNAPQRVYASEILDANTCSPCASIDGTEWSSVAEAEVDYPGGGFVECEGGLFCRGTLVAVY